MEQAEQEHRAILIVEDDAALRSLAAALFEDEQVNTINYSIDADGACHFEFVDGKGNKRVEDYKRRPEGPPANGGPPKR